MKIGAEVLALIGSPRRRRRSLAVLICSATIAMGLIPATGAAVASPRTDTGRVSLARALRAHELEPVRIYRCRQWSRSSLRCSFAATGVLAGSTAEYRCRGLAARTRGRWTLPRCYAPLLWRELLARGLRPVSIGGCGSEPEALVGCTWSAAGVWTGEVPYRCSGKARYETDDASWQIDSCENEYGPIEPLETTPGPVPVLGINENWLQRETWPFLDAAAAIGATVDRVALPWAPVERRPGSYDFSHMDAVYTRIRATGARPLWILGSPPCWAQDDPSACSKLDNPTAATYPPAVEMVDEFADFTVLAAERYPDSTGFEIWNEPNHDHFFHDPDPARYAQIVQQVAGHLDAATAVPVIAGGINPLKVDTPTADLISDASFLRGVYRAGGFGPVDALAYHVYWGDAAGYRLEIRRAFARIYGVMDDYGDERPLWITEIGADSTRMYSVQRQAAVLVDVLAMLRRIREIPVVVIHRMLDTARDSHGVLDQAGQPKPVYCALAFTRSLTPSVCQTGTG